MNKTVVIYESKYGSTRRYAQWIAKELGCPLFERKRKVILFTCGIANPEDPDNVSSIRKSLAKILSPEMLKHIRIFHLRGAIDYSRLNLIHRSMMSMLRRMLLKKDAGSLREEDRQLLETYGKFVDFTDRKSIHPLIEYANDCIR